MSSPPERSARRRRAASLALRRGALAGALAFLAAVGALAADVSPSPAGGSAPVLVELFTSQGCSSCPPADRLLTRLGADAGVRIVPLAFHIDSWNSLGWNDPFSQRGWTERHAAYAGRLGLLQVTPQAIVGGRLEVVGADEAKLRAAIAEAASLATAGIRLELEPGARNVRAQAELSLPAALAGRKLDLMFAVYETGLVTPVARGENGGRELQNDYVVRSLTRAARVAASAAGSSTESATLKLDERWHRDALGVAAFLQDPATLEIVGANAARLPSGG